MKAAPSRQSKYLTGAACGLAAVSIWASWHVLTRLAVTSNLDASDVAALRFGLAGLLLSPVVVRRGFGLDRLGWFGLVLLIFGLGAPYALIAAAGLRFAPAYDSGALNPGSMPLFVALIAASLRIEQLGPARKLGLLPIAGGVLVIIGVPGDMSSAGWNVSRSFGDLLFLAAGFLSAASTLVMRRAGLGPLHAAAIIATGSLIIYLPAYILLHGSDLARVPPGNLVVQALFQGVLVTIVGIFLYGRAIAVLGASGGAAFGALVPVLAGLFGIPLLGEWPNPTGWTGISLISAGVYLASGGPLPIATLVASDVHI
ncbi:MAG TPA: DMT family transporter [Acetobacteraceae bacterium]|nr:DMT family transporter [Acetobacteraceae bacterium]